MSKLLKNMVWPVIFLGILLAIIYYRAFLFTPNFNLPVDAAIDDASKSIDFKIPSYQLSDNEQPVYNQLFGESEATTDGALNNTTEVQSEELDNTDSQALVEVEVEIEEEAESDSGLGIDEIVLAVRTTVNEALEIFKEENKQGLDDQPVDKKSVLTESEMLFKARLAYWNRDLKTAEETYIALTELAEDPNAYGELGNLYYMQSKWKKASEAYYHAAIKLKSINQIDQAYHLLRIIRGLDSSTANKLQSELQQSS